MVTADMRFDSGVLDTVTSSISTFSMGFDDLTESFNDGEFDMSFIKDFSDAVSKLGNGAKQLSGIDTDSLGEKVGGIKSALSSGGSGDQVDLFSNVKLDTLDPRSRSNTVCLGRSYGL